MKTKTLPFSHILLAATMAMIAGGASAAKVDANRALQRALATTSARRAASIRNNATDWQLQEHTDHLYLFSDANSGEYLIAPAHTECAPVLTYGTTGSELPAPMKWWLEMYDEEMATWASSSQSSAPAYPARTNTLTDVEPLLTCKWNQDAPYNKMCPNEFTGNITGPTSLPTYTGCVATAMAQIMYYHKWPVKGIGDYANVTFDWDNMLDEYIDGAYTDTQADAVANLMRECGRSVNMAYGSRASAAATPLSIKALGDYFGYEKSTMRTIHRDAMPLHNVQEILGKELREGRPILIGADTHNVGQGHAFVVDGCTADGFFHVNWGWGGMSDGYFRLSALDPDMHGIGGASSAYNYQQDFYIGIQKRYTDIDSYPDGDYALVANGDLFYNNSYWYTDNAPVFSGIINISPSATEFILGIQAVNTTTGEIFTHIYNPLTLKTSNYIENIRASHAGISSQLTDGDYELYPAYKISESGTVHRIAAPLGMKQYQAAKVVNGQITLIDTAKESNLSIDRIDWPQTITKGDVGTISLDISNIDSDYYHGDITVTLHQADNEAEIATLAYLMTDAEPQQSVCLSASIAIPSALDNGEYYFTFADLRKKILGRSQQFSVTDPDLTKHLALDATNFPDEAFRKYLSDIWDKDADGYLSPAELAQLDYVLIYDEEGITSLQGVELLPNLTTLRCEGNSGLSGTVDVSNCAKLQEVQLWHNNIDRIILGNHPALTNLNCSHNRLTDIDLTGCPALTELSLQDNQLTTLDISSCQALIRFDASDNCLTKVTSTGTYPSLTEIYLNKNQIEHIDISHFTAATYINLGENRLLTLDLSNNPLLEELLFHHNRLTSIRLDDCPVLSSIFSHANCLEVYTADNGTFDLNNLSKYGFNISRLTSFENVTEGHLMHFPTETVSYWYRHGGTAINGIQCEFQLKSLGVSALSDLETDIKTGQATVYDTSGRRLPGINSPGLYIITQGDSTRKILIP